MPQTATDQVFRHRPRFTILPSPSELSEYERLVPGTADRLVKLAEQSAQRRAAIETEYLRVTASTERLRILTHLAAIGASGCVMGLVVFFLVRHQGASLQSLILTGVAGGATVVAATGIGGWWAGRRRGHRLARPSADTTASRTGV